MEIHHSEYWGIDITGLTEQEAQRVVEWSKEAGIGQWGADAYAPHDWYMTKWDAPTVELVLNALASSPHKATVLALVEDMEEWLASASDAEEE